MEEDIRRWFAGRGQRFLQNAGLRAGDAVLDFGCGRGCYTIPAARVVGNRGVVYAVDRSEYFLSELMREACAQKLVNIVPLRSIDCVKRATAERPLNVVLLYDVIHSYYFTREQRNKLIIDLVPALSPNGIMSIFPRHMSSGEFEDTKKHLKALGFILQKRMEAELLHDNRFSSGTIYTFGRSRTALRSVFTASSAQ
jgi:cyclopropane fatty-acyl-phospholipid synthase-like methyltransferase